MFSEFEHVFFLHSVQTRDVFICIESVENKIVLIAFE